MRLPSVMSHDFSKNPTASIPRSAFLQRSGYKSAINGGYLYPIYISDVMPADTFNMKSHIFCRMNTLLTPVMDNIYLDTFWFFVPYRLVWDNWQKMMGERLNPDDDIDYSTPKVNCPSVGFGELSLYDYMGIPPLIDLGGVTGGTTAIVQNLYARGYNLIWNDWFRSGDLQDSVVVDTDDGPDDASDYVLLRRNKRHDFFTACLPYPYKSDDDILLPLGDTAPVLGIGKETQTFGSVDKTVYESDGTQSTYDDNQLIQSVSAGTAYSFWVEMDPNNTGYPYIRTDLSNATAATINELREAFQVQKLLERDARGGSRYTELIYSHFGVTSPDARLQRPEFLNSQSVPVMINAVAQQGGTTANNSQGDLTAYATATIVNDGFLQSFTEWGFVMCLVSLRADLSYQQGLHKMFTRSTRYDYYWPELQALGEQAVYLRELYVQDVDTVDDPNSDVFGYMPPYDEYRYAPSLITANLRSGYTGGSLDPWHLSQEFGSAPTLSSDFIEEDPPFDRIVAVLDPLGSHAILDAYFENRAVRPMPSAGVPGMIDHF